MKPEHPELFALEFGKIADTDFVYTLASPNMNQSAPNLVKMYVTIRSRMSSIMDLIGEELSELFALEFTKIAESDFVLVQLWVKSNCNIWSYLPLNKEKLFNLTLVTLLFIYK